ncbi:MAG TPA: Sec-independent protein translocase subunit TatA [Pseudonocardia sp.]|jgi:sec-independent protein translocase protein TatA|uniref:Sec-independent protein translocase subunit TatA n=1 Tax=Pseudonocardia sp. TaxID=60912 RepID=UPI002B4B2E44|nr:Sec-independent protein translocase subunit TatA [Pseudonocardia sp.]HLU57554.1 Sec-independent protein translocase subunit TatA [Pseudonocardia sp.]
MPNLGGWELVILIGVLVLLFGAKRLPDMARSIGQSARVFKGEMKGLKEESAKSETQTTDQAATPEPKPLPEGQAKAEEKTPEATRASQPGSGSTSAQ